MPSNISIPGAVAIAILVVLVLIVIVRNIYVVQQSKAYVVERLGAFHSVWGVGLHLKVPFIERVVKKVSLKEQVADFDPQPVITKDNVTMKIEELEDKSGVEVSGRGILHLSVLMESMRREGFEFQVGRPRVLFKKDENGNKMEPVEQAVVECPDEYSGKVVEVFGTSGGIMTSMDTSGIVTHLEFKIPTRGIMGLKNRIMNVTHGEGVFYHTFLEYGPYAGEIGNRQNGAMISMTTEKAVAYALGTLQERGQLFVEPGTECYEGMIVGERSKAGDMVVNIARTKNLGNQRSSTSDISVQLVPPRTFSLEEALEYIADDELVEITPKNIRLRKRLLNATDRKKAAVRAGQVNK